MEGKSFLVKKKFRCKKEGEVLYEGFGLKTVFESRQCVRSIVE